MQYSNNYRLESAVNTHAKKFAFLEALSLALKIAALLLLIIFIKYFYIAIAVWIVSVAVNFMKRNLIYRYVYKINEGKLYVLKEYNIQKNEICVETDIKEDISDFYFGSPEGGCFFGEAQDEVLVIKTADKVFSLAADDYFYALTDYYKKGKK